MSLEIARLMVGYNYWAHRKVWDYVMKLSDEQFMRPLDYSIGSIHFQVVHTMSAEWIWLSRLKGTSPTSMLAPDDYPTREAVRARWDDLETEFRAYVETLTPDDLMQEFTYQRTNGQTMVMKRLPILLHVVNHGTDHRAQILAMMHGLGAETVAQDLVWYLSEVNV